jgi:hypothetical protein
MAPPFLGLRQFTLIRKISSLIPNYFSALIYINAKSQKSAWQYRTERDNRALKPLGALLGTSG